MNTNNFKIIPTKMIMIYALITPEMANYLVQNSHKPNRPVSAGTVLSYKTDMLNGNWNYGTGQAICLDEDENIIDGQHRLRAVIESGVSIYSWVCINAPADGLYDSGRKRSIRDQLNISCPDLEAVYKTNRYISVARLFIDHKTDIKHNRRKVSSYEIQAFTNEHKKDLDGFWGRMPQSTASKISVATVFAALYMAYVAGVGMDNIYHFYEVLVSGMSIAPEDFPIIAYRNYLKDKDSITTSYEEIAKCQYALHKYLTKSCTKRIPQTTKLIYGFPYEEDKK